MKSPLSSYVNVVGVASISACLFGSMYPRRRWVTSTTKSVDDPPRVVRRIAVRTDATSTATRCVDRDRNTVAGGGALLSSSTMPAAFASFWPLPFTNHAQNTAALFSAPFHASYRSVSKFQGCHREDRCCCGRSG